LIGEKIKEDEILKKKKKFISNKSNKKMTKFEKIKKLKVVKLNKNFTFKKLI
jgi:hypothetical protein